MILLSDTKTVMCAGGQRKTRAAPSRRRRRQAPGADEEEDVEAEFNPENPYQVSHTNTLAIAAPSAPPEQSQLSARI